MYKNITIENLRGIKHLKIEDFRRINLFVGKNDCGKTTILESLFLLTGSTNAELPLRTNLFRGYKLVDGNTWDMLFNRFSINSNLRISGELKDPSEKRILTIKPNAKSASYTKPAEAAVTEESIAVIDSFSALMPATNGLTLEFDLTRKSRKTEQIITKITKERGVLNLTRPPTSYKEYLNGVFINSATISENMATRFNVIQIEKKIQKVVEIMHRMNQSLHNLVLGENEIIYCDTGLNRLVPINAMGGGLSRLLSIILAISVTQNGIVLIDEIENGFHYSSQEILWKAIFESAKEFNVQIFATTHSLESVKVFSSSYSQVTQNSDNIRLYRIERKNDKFRAVKYDYKTLEASLGSDWEVR